MEAEVYLGETYPREVFGELGIGQVSVAEVTSLQIVFVHISTRKIDVGQVLVGSWGEVHGMGIEPQGIAGSVAPLGILICPLEVVLTGSCTDLFG